MHKQQKPVTRLSLKCFTLYCRCC